jgi:ABC-type sugar transport system ATPase subunit
VDRDLRSLSIAQQQLVEIAKALSIDARVVIMDEPTAALNPSEVARLFDVIARLKADGRAVLFISHRLDEVLAVADVITVLKDGNLIGSVTASTTSKDELVRMMVGRALSDAFPSRESAVGGATVLSATGLVTDHVHDVSFELKAGEILGLAGLEGHGQVYVARALAGLESIRQGALSVGGKRFRPRHPADAIAAGIAFVSDDRRGEGLALMLSVSDNIAMPNLGACAPHGLMNASRKRSITERAISAVGVRTPSIERMVQYLSGGNQQKVVLAKWLVGEPRVYVFVEPTRGIDVGAKLEIYGLMRTFAEEGRSIVMVSSDMLELIGMADRILVMRDGRIAAELGPGEASEESVMRAAAGLSVGQPA